MVEIMREGSLIISIRRLRGDSSLKRERSFKCKGNDVYTNACILRTIVIVYETLCLRRAQILATYASVFMRTYVSRNFTTCCSPDLFYSSVNQELLCYSRQCFSARIINAAYAMPRACRNSF